MRITFPVTKGIVVLLAVIGFSGCSNSQHGTASPKGATAADEHGHDHADAHDHEETGPHGGEIIELGEEEYHAELMHDDAAHKVGIHLLDSSAKAAASTDAGSIVINCIVQNRPVQFTLTAAPQPGDATGQASYFELVSEELSEGLDAAGANPRLNVTIAGKPFVADIGTHHH